MPGCRAARSGCRGLVGEARAKEMILLGKRITAARALEIGLVNAVVPRDQLATAVEPMLAELAACAPLSLQQAKIAIERGHGQMLETGLKVERTCYDVTLLSADRDEGLAAFAAGRECGFGLCPEGSMCDDTNHACIPPGCGDGVVNNAEDFDGPIAADTDCTTFGYYNASGLACSPSCTFDTSQCAGICGDHLINGPELCDGIPPAGSTCADFGFEIGRLSCTLDCSAGFAGCETIGWQAARGNAPDELHAVWSSSGADIFHRRAAGG